MSLWRRLSSKLQTWLEGDDPFQWESQAPSVSEMAHLLERHSLSSQLPYEAYDREKEIYHNQSTVGFILECSPLVGANLIIQKTLSSLFTTAIPEGGVLQVLLYASPKIAPSLEAFYAARIKAGEVHQSSAKALTDYLKQGAYEPLFSHDQILIRDFKVYLSLTLDNELPDAFYQLTEAKTHLMTSLENANIGNRSLPPEHLIQLVRELTTGNVDPMPEPISYDVQKNLAEQMVSLATHPLLRRNRLQLGEHFDVRVLAAEQFPAVFLQADMQELIGHSIERGGKIGCPFLFAFNFHLPNQSKQQTRAAFKSTRWAKLARGPLRNLVPLAEDVNQDWQLVNRRINLGDRFAEVQFLVTLYAAPDNANRLETVVKNHFGSLGWKLRSTGTLTFPAWLSCLPMSGHQALMTDYMKCGLAQTLLSSNGASLAPFQGEWKGNGAPKDHLDPVLLLVGRKGQLITWSPFDNQTQGGNFNIAIAGKPGSGKSFVMQMIEQSVHGIGGQVWVIDEGRSHQKTCELLNGQVIDFSEAHISFNPFTPIQVLNDKAMILLKPMLGLMATQKRATTELEDSFLEQAIQATWQEKGQLNTITEIAHWLKSKKESIAKELGQMLFPYTKAGMYGRFVEGKATLNFENQFTLLELSGLKERPDLQPIVMLMFMYQINHYIEQSPRDTPKLLAIDEGWRHLFTQNTAQFLNEVARTVRKHGGSQMIGTQGISDFFSSPTGISIFENSDWTLMMQQKPESIQALKKSNRINMNQHMENLLESLTVVPGKFSEMMIYGPQGYTVARFMVDSFTRILYSSSAKEYEAVKTLRSQGFSLVEAVQKVAEQR
jgi:conjugal transfer ATP-binding protein TraC